MKTKILSFFLLFTLLSLIGEIIYLKSRDRSLELRRELVKIVQLPDLSISTESHSVRHRSISDTFSLFSNSPTLTEFFPSTFVYNYSPVQRKRVSRIEIEK